jgi:hypothetical protein
MFPRLDPKMYPISDDQDFIAELLVAEKVLLVQGTGFNWPHPDHFRLVFLPHEDDLREAIGRIARFLEGYRKRMATESPLVDVTGGDAAGRAGWLARAEPVHRQLRTACRPTMPTSARGVRQRRRMSVATEGDAVRGVALWRVIENTYEGPPALRR